MTVKQKLFGNKNSYVCKITKITRSAILLMHYKAVRQCDMKTLREQVVGISVYLIWKTVSNGR